MQADGFQLPLIIDYGATFVWAISGALVAARRGYDIAGITVLALVTATGGGLLRDGIFLQDVPILVRSPVYIGLVVIAALCITLFGQAVQRIRFFDLVLATVDAVGLGAFAVVGMELATVKGLSVFGIVLVGVVNAVGGSVLRDVLVRREPEFFKPGTPLATAALFGCIVFLLLEAYSNLDKTTCAWLTIVLVFTVRVLAVRMGFKTRPAMPVEPMPPDG
jgi:uncharacterized membrane protein YeiH